MTEIRAAHVLTPDGWLAPGAVTVEGSHIVDVRPLRPGERDVAPITLAPGFVDLQVNGIDDVDVASAEGDDWRRLDDALLQQGTTSWCPTLVTAPRERYPAALARIATAAERAGGLRPRLVGAHLEGPFLGGAPGAHPIELLRPIDLTWIDALPDVVRLVTLAPELDLAPDAVARLRARGVAVSLGHATPSSAQVEHCIQAGAGMVTHLYNAMSGLHHRDPGLAAIALTDDRLAAGLIADGVHVHPTMVSLAFRVKPGRIALVTDSVAWRRLGVQVQDGAPRLPDGTLAGSVLTMDAAVRTCVERAGVTVADALRAASTVPAAALGLTDRGAVEVGRLADLVALDQSLRVVEVWVGGAPTLGGHTR